MTTRENIAYFDKKRQADTVLRADGRKPHAKFLVCNGELESNRLYRIAHLAQHFTLKEQNLKLTTKQRVLHKALFIPDMLSASYEVLKPLNAGGEILP